MRCLKSDWKRNSGRPPRSDDEQRDANARPPEWGNPRPESPDHVLVIAAGIAGLITAAANTAEAFWVHAAVGGGGQMDFAGVMRRMTVGV